MQNRKDIILILILVVTAICFLPSLNNGFTNWDDNHYLIFNYPIRTISWSMIRDLFSNTESKDHHYMPLVFFSWAVEYHFFGLNPRIYILGNILLHLFNTFLVFRFVHCLSGFTNVARICALFFGIHPMHVESVVWVSERKDVLCTVFYLLALISYTKLFQSQGKVRNLRMMTWVFFILSLLSKPAAITLPLVFLVVDYYLGQREIRRAFLTKIPFFIVSFLFGLIAVAKKASMAQIASIYSLGDRIVLACYSLADYVAKLLIPLQLSAFYPYPDKINGFLPFHFYLGPIACLLVWCLWRKYFRSHTGGNFGLLFFLVTIFPMLGLVPVGNYFMADRYTYISFIGLFFILAKAYGYLTQIPYYRYMKIVAVFYVILCGVLTFQRCQIWRNDVTLWDDVLKKYPYTALAYSGRAMALWGMGREDLALMDLDKAVTLEPQTAYFYVNRGNLYKQKGQYELALMDFEKALALEPNFFGIYASRGPIYAIKGQYELALKDFNTALGFNAEALDAYVNRGYLYSQMGKHNLALEDFHRALAIDPNYQPANDAMKFVLERSGSE